MFEFYNSLSQVEVLFLFFACLGGALFMCNLVIQFLGMDHDASTHTAIDADLSFKYLSFQGIVGFTMMFGLIGLALSRDLNAGPMLSLLGGFLGGASTLYLLARMFRFFHSLNASGTVSLDSALLEEGRVYLNIPSGGFGKVQIPLQGRLRVVEATSNSDRLIQTGETVQVIEVIDGSVVKVKPIN